MSIPHNNPLTIRILRLEAQRDANTRDQAGLRHKLLFSRVPYHQTPEGQKVMSEELDSLVRVGVQIRALLADAERERDEARPAQIAAFNAGIAAWGVIESPIGLDGRSTVKEA